MQLFYRNKFKIGLDIETPTPGSSLTSDPLVEPVDAWQFSKGILIGEPMELALIVQRRKENQRFYNQKVSTEQILSDNFTRPASAKILYEALNDIEQS